MKRCLILLAAIFLLSSSPGFAKIDSNPFPGGVTAEEISELNIDGPRLRSAYAEALSAPGGPIQQGEVPGFVNPWLRVDCRDLARRGNDVIPILLDVMESNQDTFYEPRMLFGASMLEGVDIEPLLDHWRNALRKRVSDLNDAAPLVARVFARFGTNEDIALIKWFSEIRLDLEPEIHRELDNQKTALRLEGRPILKALEAWELVRDLDGPK